MTSKEVLDAMAKDGQLAEDVLGLLDAAMWDEWDCGLIHVAEHGFGPAELQIAAATAAGMAEYYDREKEKEQL